MMPDSAAQPLIKASLVLVAALLLLVQCWLGLSSQAGVDPAERVVASASALAHQPFSYAAEPSHVPESLHRLDTNRHQSHSAPAMSCCDDESQPITLAELQLLPLIFLLMLMTVLISITRTLKPQAPFLSPRRLHKLHCCWLN